MGRLDVMKSLLRSAAREAKTRVDQLELGSTLRDFADQAVMRRIAVDEQRLTAAVGRVPGIASATVSVTERGVAVQAVDDAGTELSVTFQPHAVLFAAGGAKEVTFRTQPPEAAERPRCGEVFGAIATEIARALWGPFLRRQPSGGSHQVFVHRKGALLSADLRTVPEVRAAAAQPVTANILDLLRLKRINVGAGEVTLEAGLEGMP